MKRAVLLILFLFFAEALLAQEAGHFPRQDSLPADTVEERVPPMTVRRYRGQYIMTPLKVATPAGASSLAFLPDSLIRDTLQYEYTKIKALADRNRLTRELYKMFFINPSGKNPAVLQTQNSEERFERYADKMILGISVKILPPYSGSIYDSAYVESDIAWWKNVVNKTHIGTTERVILRQLTLKPGMALRPFELVQNEILLRNLDYIDDATINIVPLLADTNTVYLEVVCKDELSWRGSVETNFLNSFSIGVGNRNFFKLGHIIDYEFSHRGTRDKKWGNILEYKANSLWGTHIDVRGYYRNDDDEKQLRVDIERQFLTSRMKWAGGISAGRVWYSDDLPDRTVSRLEELFNYHYQDLWIGHSFRRPTRYRYNRNIYLTGRFFTTFFNNRPEVNNDTNHLYYNRMNVLSTIAYAKIKYYKANLIYDFGRTEDIPAGLLLKLTGGYEWNEYNNYAYVAAEAQYSHFDRFTERYYAFHAALGSYLNTKRFERGVLEVGGSHISNLCTWGSLRYRFYNDFRYIRGIRRYPADYLYMEDRDIRGFSSDSLRGKQKVAISLATTVFLPFITKGFRTALSAYVDAGLIAPDGEKLFRQPAYWGIGVALNLRNDNVVIKNICFRFTFYPTLPVDGSSAQATMTDGMGRDFYDYRVSKPQVIQYE